MKNVATNASNETTKKQETSSPTSVMEMRKMPLFVASMDSEDLSVSSNDEDVKRQLHYKDATKATEEKEHIIINNNDLEETISVTSSSLSSSSNWRVSTYFIHYPQEQNYNLNCSSSKDTTALHAEKIKDCISSALASATMQSSNMSHNNEDEEEEDILIDDITCECMTFDPAQSEWMAKFTREEDDEEDLDCSVYLLLHYNRYEDEKEEFILKMLLVHGKMSLTETQDVTVRLIYERVKRFVTTTLIKNQYHVANDGTFFDDDLH
uniref:Uncharacterized protein n=2 Tax=Ditylum brightwellii TaxID=49249 RepID=A0A7S4T9Y9_9STRA|mmetsp:Transcript_56357/g.83775  ORF Transcript_56357/g.83775 Transcript_56357/m.83775 type:complete len:266 (+) Transcript_56357:394-1191(+)